MIIHPNKYEDFICQMSMSGPEIRRCVGPKCMAWEELPLSPDRSVIVEEKFVDITPGKDWFYAPVPNEAHTGTSKSRYVRYEMPFRATCGMITKDEVYVYNQA